MKQPPARTAEATALTTLILELFRCNGALLAAGNRLTRPHGLTSARWQVMGAIELEARPMTVSQIARRMGLARQGVRRIVNDLQRLDMVALLDNPDHQRAKLVSLTPRGERALANIDKAQILWANELSRDLTERQISRAIGIVKAVRTRAEHPDESHTN